MVERKWRENCCYGMVEKLPKKLGKVENISFQYWNKKCGSFHHSLTTAKLLPKLFHANFHVVPLNLILIPKFL